MKSNLTVVIDHLQSCMGELAEKFIAKEMLKINRKFVTVEIAYGGYAISFPNNAPHLNEGDLDKLIQRVDNCLGVMIGPQFAKKIIKNIEDDIASIMMEMEPLTA